MKHTAPQHVISSSADTPIVRETVEMFLARGGCITKCPPMPAQGASMYVPVIAIDGHTLPVLGAGNEYLPNFVRDLTTYDTAQRDPVTPNDDGSSAIVREDLSSSMRHIITWRDRINYTLRREDTDIMEEQT